MRRAAPGRLGPGAGFFLLVAVACLSGAAPAATPLEPIGLGWASPQDSARAVESLRRRVREDRADVDARRDLAALLVGSGDIEARREAASVLTEALLSRPGDAELWVRFARLQDRRGFHREAREAYARALELAPARPDLRNELSSHQLRRYQRTLRGELLEEAAEENRVSLSLDPANPDALRRAVRLALYEGRPAELDSLCRLWREVEPASGWPDLVGAARLTEKQAWRRAAEAYSAGFARLSPKEIRPFATLAVVDPAEEALRRAAPDSARFWMDYWRWRDPTPADLENPRLLEHYRRVVQAELLFGIEAGSLRGWEHAPGQALVRYGLPEDFNYRRDVVRAREYRISPTFAAPAMEVRLGESGAPLHFTFIDYNLSGRFFNPIEGRPRDADLFMVGTPTTYASPYTAPDFGQEVELWRFQDPRGKGRIEIVAALAPDEWPEDLLETPHRIAAKVALYDDRWTLKDSAVASWARFERDPLGRLVGIFTVDGIADSAIVGLETSDRGDRARAASFATLPPTDGAGEGPSVSDIAFLTRVDFGAASGRYRRAYGAGLPNPGHRYPVGAPLGIGFEAYGLAVGADGAHRARVRVSVGRPSPAGWVKVLLRAGRNPAQAELAFEVADPGPTLEQILSLDIPPLDPGRYQLQVEIEDLLSGRSARRIAPFTVLSPGRTR